jgi:crotonobetainyl-CoA:carnitine CoA-transferase CaiB-like acyl-CoA transferase
LLLDLGAEVTKIEPPSGDPMRNWGPFPCGVPDPNRSGLFEYLNAGKYGATVDLADDKERSVAEIVELSQVRCEFPPPRVVRPREDNRCRGDRQCP